ncbi:hypothetical protein GCM10017771_23710 [Streptomyces capitiformicae]|uniref:Uncharacterized protein n=1 Tax=Streptomyces capitiformicae TaxID=2014920 RepID=A0A919GLZ5_9ACTN|nr:hypothetical protein GCM10017771_23710 [Streptomyces capitiformicae]
MQGVLTGFAVIAVFVGVGYAIGRAGWDLRRGGRRTGLGLGRTTIGALCASYVDSGTLGTPIVTCRNRRTYLAGNTLVSSVNAKGSGSSMASPNLPARNTR